MALRWLAVALVLLLLFNPRIAAVPDTGPATAVLLDRSTSMGFADDASWAAAVDSLRATDQPLLLFGDDVRAVSPTVLDTLTPSARNSLLEPALRAAAETGAPDVAVWTDGRLADARRADRLARDLTIAVTIHRIPTGRVVNRGITRLDVPDWARAGTTVDIGFDVAALTPVGAGDSLDIVLLDDGQAAGRSRVAAPAPGRVASGNVSWTPRAPRGARLARLELRIDTPDAAADDDVRTAYVHVTERPAAVVLISFEPDWEPRFLAPALQRALGLPVAVFLAVEDGFVRAGSGEEGAALVAAARTRSAAAAADLLVLHRWTGDGPAWAQEAARSARRVLVFPGSAVAPGTPLEPAALGPGEWYLGGVPASPVAALLEGLEVEGLPPLEGVRLLEPSDGAWTALTVTRGRRGAVVPAVVAGTDGERRWAVATGRGHWRWAFHGASGAYERIWSAIGGWLMEEREVAREAPVRPAPRVVRRGTAVRWAAALDADSLELEVRDTSGVVVDTVVAMTDDEARTAALPPGHYRYHARAVRSGVEVASATGPFTVDRYLEELTRMEADAVTGRSRARPTDAPAGLRRPVRATAWPYVVLVLLVVVEWTLRRRWGLR